MAFLKKVARAVASGSPVAAGKSSGMFGGAISKALQNPKVKEAMARDAVAKTASARRSSLAGTGMMGNRTVAVGNTAATVGKKGAMDMAKRGAMGRMGSPFQKGGTVDKAGRALGKKTADSMGRAMAKAPMKKNMGGMAKKSSKKC
jgi:hypothetical protein